MCAVKISAQCKAGGGFKARALRPHGRRTPAQLLLPALEAAYMNPDRPAACAQLRVQAIAYLVVPQALAHPERWQQQLRWRAPAVWAQRPRFEASACLALRADFDGAQVWQVIGAS